MRRFRRACMRAGPGPQLLATLLFALAAARQNLGSQIISSQSDSDASLLGDSRDAGPSDGAIADTGGRANAERSGYDSAFNYTALECSRYDPTYTQIDSDLELGRKVGITLAATRYAAARLGSVTMRGLSVG
jgi:hypothetical protein